MPPTGRSVRVRKRNVGRGRSSFGVLSPSGRAAAAFRRVPLAMLVAAFGAVCVAVTGTGAGSPQLRSLIAHAATMPGSLLVALLSGLAARSRTLDPRVRRALAYNALTFVSVFAGNAVWAYEALIRHSDPARSAAGAFYLLGYPFSLGAFLSIPTRRKRADDRWTFALDVSTVVIAGAMIVGWVVYRFHPAISRPYDLADVVAVLDPIGSFLQIFAIGAVLVRRPTDGNRGAFSLLTQGYLISIAANLTYGLVYPAVGRHGLPITAVLYALTYVALVASGELYLRSPVRLTMYDGARSPGPPGVSGFPYAAVILGNGIVVFVALTTAGRPVGLLAVGAAMLAAVVLVRQYLAVRLTARLLRDRGARDSEARFRALVQHSSDAIIVVDRAQDVQFVSPSVMRLFGHLPGELVGRPLAHMLHPDDAPGVVLILAAAALDTTTVPPFEMRVRHARGSWVHVEAIGTNLLHEPTVSGIVLNTRDVSERKSLERQLTHQAFHDPLTDLANRALFRDRVGHALSVAARTGGPIAVLFLDLDDFKTVNDSLGHAIGDRLLSAAATRLLTCVRGSDTVARLGGDEFAVLIEDTAAAVEAEIVAVRIGDALRQPFNLDGAEVIVSTSIGIAHASLQESADDLLRNADVAMYMAKGRGKGGFQVFEPTMHARILDRLELESDLRRVVDRGELLLHYQPIVSLASGEILGVEALVRWAHPKRGLLAPGAFIHLAEETGTINALGRWVLAEACAQGMRWRGGSAARWPRLLSVNISGRQLQERQQPGDDFVADVRAVLAHSGIDPEMLVLEITESVLMQPGGATLANLQALKELGVSLAIDDFGTGYSSLSYLERFPVDTLKVAKPFVDAVGRGSEEAALARAILAMGRTLKLRTIAEGIETSAQHRELAALGCELGQGNYLGEPMTVAEIDARLAQAAATRGRGAPALPLAPVRRPLNAR